MQGNFRVLQDNFRALVEENTELRRSLEELEETNKGSEKVDRTYRYETSDKDDNTEGRSRKNSELNKMGSQNHLFVERSISQSMMRKKPSEGVSISQPKKSLALDLQNLQSQTSMVSPKASESGQPNKISMFMMNR